MKPIRMLRMGARAALVAILLSTPHPEVCGAEEACDQAATPHERVSCSLCHGFDGSHVSAAQTPAPFAAVCIGCHGFLPASADRRLDFHGRPERSCVQCHRFHHPARLIREGGAPVEGVEAHCAACHALGSKTDRLSPGHRAAAALYHEGDGILLTMSPSEACLSCHGARRAGEAIYDAPLLAEHSSHAWGVTLIPGATDPRLRIRSVLDPRIRLYDDRIECISCHDLTGGEEDLLLAFRSHQELCQGCHEQGHSPAQDLGPLAGR